MSLILGAEPEHQQAFAERGPRPAHLERRRGRRLLALDAGAADAPDIQFHCAPVMFVDEGLGDPSRTASRSAPACSRRGAAGACRCARTTRRAKPWIRHDFYGEPDDVEVMIEGAADDDGDRARSRRSRPTAGSLFVAPESDDDADLRAHLAPQLADALPPGRHLRDGRRWWTPSCACTASKACAWSTHR